MNYFILLLTLTFAIPSFAQDSNSPLVSFDDYEILMAQVKEHRKTHLVDLNEFNAMSAQNDVYILDTRSKEMYDRKHVKGAIHLNFSDFTQDNLDKLFPNRNATILIYCNNNFVEVIKFDSIRSSQLLVEDQDFASKVPRQVMFNIKDLQLIQDSGGGPNPVMQMNTGTHIESIELEESPIVPVKPITLALNIPTYINLYGYGYRNVFELSELVIVSDPRIQFEGTSVNSLKN